MGLRDGLSRNLKLWVFVLASGFILFFYSELMFWARPRPEDSFSNWLVTWLAYALIGLAYLAALQTFRVRHIWGVYLGGALFGWLAEGVLVQTMYDAFPLQISWTGLAWHALISVWLGWYAVRRALHRGRPLAILGLASALGLFWGVWGIFWWVEEPGQPIPGLGAFAGFAWTASAGLVLAYWLADRCGAGFAPGRLAVGLVGAALGVLFVFGTLQVVPLAIFVLPPLLAVLFLALWRNRQKEPPGSLLDVLHGPLPGWRYGLLLAMPLAATAVYAAALALEARVYSGWLVYAVTTPLGFILFVLSLVKTAFSPKPDTA